MALKKGKDGFAENKKMEGSANSTGFETVQELQADDLDRVAGGIEISDWSSKIIFPEIFAVSLSEEIDAGNFAAAPGKGETAGQYRRAADSHGILFRVWEKHPFLSVFRCQGEMQRMRHHEDGLVE